MRQGAGIAAVVLLAFTAGWWIGRTTTLDLDTEARLAALEEGLEALESARAAPAAPRPRAERRGPDPEKVHALDLDGAPSLGPAEAPVTIVEFSDFECPFCRRVAPTLRRVREEYPERVRVVWKHFPLSFHKNALPAHKATLAAARQGRFWELHDWVFAAPENIQLERLRARAAEIGLDMERFEQDMQSGEVARTISEDLAEGRRLGVSGTPAFFINGRYLSGAQPYSAFEARIEEELAKRS